MENRLKDIYICGEREVGKTNVISITINIFN